MYVCIQFLLQKHGQLQPPLGTLWNMCIGAPCMKGVNFHSSFACLVIFACLSDSELCSREFWGYIYSFIHVIDVYERYRGHITFLATLNIYKHTITTMLGVCIQKFNNTIVIIIHNPSFYPIRCITYSHECLHKHKGTYRTSSLSRCLALSGGKTSNNNNVIYL